jgi:hypothetical protein
MTFGVRHRFLEYNRLPISQVRNTDKPYLRFLLMFEKPYQLVRLT